MTLTKLNKLEDGWIRSDYNEDTSEEINYYINESHCNIGDEAYVFVHEEEWFAKLEILYIIRRSEDCVKYDSYPEDILYKSESGIGADTSAEFITDYDSYLVWFRLIEEIVED